jgi:hypothetical protein
MKIKPSALRGKLCEIFVGRLKRKPEYITIESKALIILVDPQRDVRDWTQHHFSLVTGYFTKAKLLPES